MGRTSLAASPTAGGGPASEASGVRARAAGDWPATPSAAARSRPPAPAGAPSQPAVYAAGVAESWSELRLARAEGMVACVCDTSAWAVDWRTFSAERSAAAVVVSSEEGEGIAGPPAIVHLRRQGLRMSRSHRRGPEMWVILGLGRTIMKGHCCPSWSQAEALPAPLQVRRGRLAHRSAAPPCVHVGPGWTVEGRRIRRRRRCERAARAAPD